MLVYRVFPFLARARAGEPGHPSYVQRGQGHGRWDNPVHYDTLYVAASPTGAIGETFAHVTNWSYAMLPHPTIGGAVRALGVYSLNEDEYPVLDLDDPHALVHRGLRPTDIVKRNRPRSQQIALDVFRERRWSGLSWWSMHRPQWTLYALWHHREVTVERVEPLSGHPALLDAARSLARSVEPGLSV